MIKLLSIMLISMLFSGCSFFNLGESQGYCEERGCDYSDAGVCDDAFVNFQTRYKDIERSYAHVPQGEK